MVVVCTNVLKLGKTGWGEPLGELITAVIKSGTPGVAVVMMWDDRIEFSDITVL